MLFFENVASPWRATEKTEPLSKNLCEKVDEQKNLVIVIL